MNLETNIFKLTKDELREIILTLEIGSCVRVAVAELKGENWEKIEDQVKPFLKLAQILGYSDLVQESDGELLPSDKLCKEVELILEGYGEEEFWSNLEVRLGQRDFFEKASLSETKKMKKDRWFPDSVHKFYTHYAKEFEKYGVDRLQIVEKRKTPKIRRRISK